MLAVAGLFLARMAADNGLFTPNGVIACAMLAVTMFTAALLVDRFRSTSYAQIASALALAAKAWPTR